MSSILIFLSSALALISPVIYGRAILKGEAKPHRTTRFILFIIAALSTAALFANGNTVAVWLAGTTLIQGAIILILSIKRGMGGWTKIDLACLVIALIGIIAWQTTKNPIIGLYCSILADFTGMVPALIKTYHFPKTEIATFFILDIFAAFFSLLATSNWSSEQITYPVYIGAINAIMVALILWPRPKTAPESSGHSVQ